MGTVREPAGRDPEGRVFIFHSLWGLVALWVHTEEKWERKVGVHWEKGGEGKNRQAWLQNTGDAAHHQLMTLVKPLQLAEL